MTNTKYLTRRDLAVRFRVSTRTIDNWHSQGLLPPAERTPTGMPRWSEEAVQAVMKPGGAK